MNTLDQRAAQRLRAAGRLFSVASEFFLKTLRKMMRKAEELATHQLDHTLIVFSEPSAQTHHEDKAHHCRTGTDCCKQQNGPTNQRRSC
jgi:hypothetical protein